MRKGISITGIQVSSVHNQRQLAPSDVAEMSSRLTNMTTRVGWAEMRSATGLAEMTTRAGLGGSNSCGIRPFFLSTSIHGFESSGNYKGSLSI
jgi:hypothetical protein